MKDKSYVFNSMYFLKDFECVFIIFKKGEVEEDGKENENGEVLESVKVIEENIEKLKGKSRKKFGKISEKFVNDEEMILEGGDKEEFKKRGRKRKLGEMEESKGEE